MKHPPVYGLMAEFETPTALVDAAQVTYNAGYRKIDAYSPFPIEELSEAIGFHRNGVAPIVLVGGELSHQCRWKAVSLVAVIHHRDL
jgi:hypothetical protein